LGIVVGSALVRPAVDEQIARRLDSLGKQFNEEIQSRRQESERNTRFSTALVPWLVKGKLVDKRVAIVQTGDYPDTVARVREIVESAGASVTSVTVMDRGFPTRAQTNFGTLLPKLLSVHPDLPKDASALLRLIAIVLSRGGDRDLQPLEDERLIRTEGEYGLANDYVIVVGGASQENESRAELLDVPLVGHLREKGLTVVHAEPEAAAISYIPMLKPTDISTIDNADTDIGRIALVLALRGERGHYGVKTTASSGILPSPSASDDLRRRTGL
jgi:hypothetical protein